MKQELLNRVANLGERYFGSRQDTRIVRAIEYQLKAMTRDGSEVNVRKQAGDILFLLYELARNHGWDAEELLEERVDALEQRRQERHYYEAHVTVEPVFEDDLERMRTIAQQFGFRVATLLMQKRQEDTPERSKNDTFCTGRSISRSDLQDRMLGLVFAFRTGGFTVWRYKVEETLLDSNYDDSEFPLDKESIPEKYRNPRAPAEGAFAGRAK